MVSVTTKRERVKTGGFTLVELLVVALILTIVLLSVGSGFVRLSQLEDLNREKARVLEAVCNQFTWTQPYVAAGCTAVTDTNRIYRSGCVSIDYPHIVFGIACETNYFTFVTNTTLSVREDGALQTVIAAGQVTGTRSMTNAMSWMDTLFSKTVQPWTTNSSVSHLSADKVALNYRQGYVLEVNDGIGRRIWVTNVLGLTIPVRLRNRDYQ